MGRMTIRQCMDAALQLLNQYSIAGSIVPLSYNDQADTENRMLNLINDAQMQIATTVKPIDASVVIEVPEPESNVPLGEISTKMPDGFNHSTAIYFKPLNDFVTRTVDARKYKWVGDDTLILPDRPAGTYTVVYNRYPERYDSTTDVDTTELDNTPDTHEIIPYFVAAMIAVDENPKTYYAMYNVWETRLARLGQKPAHATPNEMIDVYGFGYFGGIDY